MNFADYLLENARADDTALIDGDQSYTYADLRHAMAALGARLQAAELAPGARICLLAPNSLLWVAGYLATIKSNLVVVPVSDKATTAELGRNLSLVECAAAIVSRRLAQRHATILDSIPILTEDALGSHTAPEWSVTGGDPDADAVLMFTSGTTDVPKAVRITHSNLRANTESIITYLGLRSADRVLVILPFFYCYGASLLHTHLRQGATVVLCNTFAYPESALALIEEHECSVFAGVPSSFQLLLRATSFTRRRLPSLRIVQQAGGKLAPVMLEELAAAQAGASVYVMYGQTEATARLSYLPPEDLFAKPGSIGRGIPGVRLRVLGEDGHEVAAGGSGEIYATGANISPGYFGDPVGSEAKFTSRGLRTGDLATIDEDGYLFIVDRRDDFIKTWGYRVSSQEIEATVLRMAELVSAAAVGTPDDMAGEAIVLFAVVQPGADVGTEAILAHCRAELPRHMVPRSIRLMPALPLNANGKVSKRALRENASAAYNTSETHDAADARGRSS